VKDPMKMLRQVQQMQERMGKLQAELENETVEASVGGGAVRAVMTGGQRLVSIAIDPSAAEDVDILQDLVVAAVNEALDKSKQHAAQRMQSLTAGMGLPPGLLQ
jgi:nucleoid-associated protein EbfC